MADTLTGKPAGGGPRVVEIVADLEAELGKPVTSSNHAPARHCPRLAGIDDPKPQFGRLFTVPLA